MNKYSDDPAKIIVMMMIIIILMIIIIMLMTRLLIVIYGIYNNVYDTFGNDNKWLNMLNR